MTEERTARLKEQVIYRTPPAYRQKRLRIGRQPWPLTANES
jgi:hypothetical protein